MILRDKPERLFGQDHRDDRFRVPEVELLRGVQILLIFQNADFPDHRPGSFVISIANGLFHL